MIVYIYGNHQAEIEKMLEEYRNIIIEYKKKLETQRDRKSTRLNTRHPG